MKKLSLILMTLLLALTCAACGQEKGSENMKSTTKTASAAAPAETKTNGKALVVYYSASGNTAKLAGTLAAAVQADLLELKPAQPYTAHDLDYNTPGTRATVEQRDESARPQLAGSIGDLKQYDTIYIGYPIWWSLAPRLMYTFVESADLSGKKVIPFCTSGGSGMGASGEALAAAAKGKGNWLKGREFSPSASSSQLKAWADSL
ncbi:MAG: flavodoxin [Selenomonadaceae bacterium]|nr:flavodoxin [Selenomonadaceae bacterium]